MFWSTITLLCNYVSSLLIFFFVLLILWLNWSKNAFPFLSANTMIGTELVSDKLCQSVARNGNPLEYYKIKKLNKLLLHMINNYYRAELSREIMHKTGGKLDIQKISFDILIHSKYHFNGATGCHPFYSWRSTRTLPVSQSVCISFYGIQNCLLQLETWKRNKHTVHHRYENIPIKMPEKNDSSFFFSV